MSKEVLTENDRSKLREMFELWNSQKETASVKQKNKVGIAFITKILNLDKETALEFVQGDREAYQEVGRAQSGIPRDRETSEFWEEVNKIFPERYDEEDIQFLKEKTSPFRVSGYLLRLDELLNEESPVLEILHRNAHAFK